MKVRDVPIGDIRPYENNPRNNDDAVELVANSIKEFGWQQPIVCDADGTIIAGHTRYKAAMRLGMETVPVVYATDLTPEQVNAYRLADNKVSEAATWDFSKLGEELDGLIDIDMDQFGFHLEDVDDFGEDFELENRDGPLYKTITLSLTEQQFGIIESALEGIDVEECALRGGNEHGDKICEVVSQWQARNL